MDLVHTRSLQRGDNPALAVIQHTEFIAQVNFDQWIINAVITIATRLRYDYDTTVIRLRRIARACFHSTPAKNEHVNFSSSSYRSRIVLESQ